MKITIGKKAPVFQAVDQFGNKQALGNYQGQWVLLYFYPKDATTGCTTEACALRDNWKDFKKFNTIVLGVSTDSQKSHKKFADKYTLPFPLLVDEDKKIVNGYGVWGKKKFMGREYMGTKRMSFLIDPQGKIAKIYDTVKPAEHAKEVLKDLKSMK